MSEATRNTALQLAGESAVSHLYGLVKALSLYEVNNQAVSRMKAALGLALVQLAGQSRDGLRLTLLSDEFFVNGGLLRISPAMYERATSLATTLSTFNINEISFAAACRPEHLDPLVEDLSASIRSGRSALKNDGYPGIAIGQTTGRSVASLRFDPRRLAIWLYCALLEETERVYRKHSEGAAPSMLRVRRSLQLIIDNMRAHSGIYQTLAAVQDWSRPLPAPRRRVAAAIDLIGFGQFMGLERSHLMNLALSELVEGLAGSADPREAVRSALGLDGLGRRAAAVVLAVHDALSARRGQPSGVPGRILAVVDAYHDDLAKGPMARSPHVLLETMSAGKLLAKDPVLESLFAAYKGPFPLGSAVQFSNGAVAAVVAQPDPLAGKQRPTVALYAPGRQLGPPIDLRSRPELQVWGDHPPGRLHFDLTTA